MHGIAHATMIIQYARGNIFQATCPLAFRCNIKLELCAQVLVCVVLIITSVYGHEIS